MDGVFEACCRPYDKQEGYRSIRQRAVYSGSKRKHGCMYQGLVGPVGIMVEMWGPFQVVLFDSNSDRLLYKSQGRINDKEMLRQSGLTRRMRPHLCLLDVVGYSV